VQPLELDIMIHESLLYIIIVCYKSMICDRCITNKEINEIWNCVS